MVTTAPKQPQSPCGQMLGCKIAIIKAISGHSSEQNLANCNMSPSTSELHTCSGNLSQSFSTKSLAVTPYTQTNSGNRVIIPIVTEKTTISFGSLFNSCTIHIVHNTLGSNSSQSCCHHCRKYHVST